MLVTKKKFFAPQRGAITARQEKKYAKRFCRPALGTTTKHAKKGPLTRTELFFRQRPGLPLTLVSFIFLVLLTRKNINFFGKNIKKNF